MNFARNIFRNEIERLANKEWGMRSGYVSSNYINILSKPFLEHVSKSQLIELSLTNIVLVSTKSGIHWHTRGTELRIAESILNLTLFENSNEKYLGNWFAFKNKLLFLGQLTSLKNAFRFIHISYFPYFTADPKLIGWKLIH